MKKKSLPLCLAIILQNVFAISTWDGGSTIDGSWSSGENWLGDIAPLTGEDLVFTGNVQTATNANDLDSANLGTFVINSLTFDSMANSFTLSGNSMYLNGKTISNQSSNVQEITNTVQASTSGFTVNCAQGNIILRSIEDVSASYNYVISKTGPHTLYIDPVTPGTNPLIGPDTFQATVSQGKLSTTSSGNVFFHCNVSAGATLETNGSTGNGVIHNGGRVTLNGTLDLMGGVTEDIGNLLGSGIVTNHGTSGTTTTLRMRTSEARTFSGTIQDGITGGATALDIGLPGNTSTGTFTLSGANTYSGNTTFRTATTNMVLASTGSMKFFIGSAGVNNRITAAVTQTTGTLTLNGSFVIDTSSASPIDGDTWNLLDTAVLNETFGASFTVQSPFVETSAGSGIWQYDTGSGVYTFSKSTGNLTFGRVGVTKWDGGASPSVNWSSNDNWDQNPLTNDLLVFAGSSVSNNNDLDTDYDMLTMMDPTFQVNGFRFDPDAAAFTLSGNAVNLSGKTIANLSTNTQTIGMLLQLDSIVGGLNVQTEAGDVVINGLELRNGSGASLTKTGAHALTIQGPNANTDTLHLTLNQGTVIANTSNNVFSDVSITSGATLQTGGTSSSGVISNLGAVVLNGTLNLAAGVNEDVGSLSGSGLVTNQANTGTTTITSANVSSTVFSGSIQNGSSGGKTALQIGVFGNSDNGILTLSGINSYSGNTTFAQAEASLNLASTSMLAFYPTTNGSTNQITASVPQINGSTSLNGKFLFDLSAANATPGNSWTIVDVANLNESFGFTFEVMNKAYVPATTYRINSGLNGYTPFDEDDSFAAGGASYPSGGPTGVSIDTSSVSDPAPQEVYQTERYGNFSYNFNGLGSAASYKVRLHFAEIFHNAANLRKFDVRINGSLMLDDFDIFQAAGGKNIANIQEFTVPASLGGTISVQFASVVDNAKISGVEIIPISGGSGNTFTRNVDVWMMVDGANTWTFNESTGVLSVASSSGNYASWAASNGIAGEAEENDFDSDGVANLLEYALGTSPTTFTTAGTFSSGVISYAKGTEAVANGDVTYAIEKSTDLGQSDPWTTVTPTVNDSSTISYTLPTGLTKYFVRLKVNN